MSCLLSTFVSKIIAFMEGKKIKTKYVHTENHDLTPSQSVCMRMHNAFLCGKSAQTLCVESVWNQKHFGQKQKHTSKIVQGTTSFFCCFFSVIQQSNQIIGQMSMKRKERTRRKKWRNKNERVSTNKMLYQKKVPRLWHCNSIFSFSSVVQLFICKTMHNAKSASYIKK